MAARYMLDTSTMIHIRSGRKPTLERLRELRPSEAVLSVVTYGELRFGAEKSTSQGAALEKLGRLIERVAIEPMTASAAIEYAIRRVYLGTRGEIIGPNDLWIAAHARSLDLILVTNNEREFRRVPGLAVENWAAS